MLPIIRNVHFEQTHDRLKIVLPAQRQPLWFARLFCSSSHLVDWPDLGNCLYHSRCSIFGRALRHRIYDHAPDLALYMVQVGAHSLAAMAVLCGSSRDPLHRKRAPDHSPASFHAWHNGRLRYEHVSPFNYSEEESCPGFDYGSRRIYFGSGLDEASARLLVKTLNDHLLHDA